MTGLHTAAIEGSSERAMALLSSGSFDIDEVDRFIGCSPLIYAAGAGHARVVKILLDKGADTSIVGAGGCAAVHVSAQEGHVAATTMLIKAGADPETEDDAGLTPLLLAVDAGNWAMVRALAQGGANVDRRSSKDGLAALHRCAFAGREDIARELLRAKADALLTTTAPTGPASVPLELATVHGHSGFVRELIQHVGIEGCGGVSRGVVALQGAAQLQHVDIMVTLLEAGVVDTGEALSLAACHGLLVSAKFLLQQRKARNPAGTLSYLESRDVVGRTPLLCCISLCPSPRMVRLFIDAGADTSSAVKINTPMDTAGGMRYTPVAWTRLHLEVLKTVNGRPATEKELDMLRAVRRLLLRVEAVRAVSWLWPDGVPYVARAAAKGSSAVNNTSAPLTAAPLMATLPVLRERARRRGVLLGAQSRLVVGKNR